MNRVSFIHHATACLIRQSLHQLYMEHVCFSVGSLRLTSIHLPIPFWLYIVKQTCSMYSYHAYLMCLSRSQTIYVYS